MGTMTGTIEISDKCDPHNVFIGWHPMLVKIVMWVLSLTGEIVITSGFRPNRIYKYDSGIHCVKKPSLRALDIRSEKIYSNPQSIADAINLKFQYDPKRPDMKCAVYHPGATGLHIHLQCHDRTTMNGQLGKTT